MQLNKKEYLKSLLKQILSEAEIDDKDIIEGFQSYLEKDDVFDAARLYGLCNNLSFNLLFDAIDNVVDDYLNSKNNDEISLKRFIMTYYPEMLTLIEEEPVQYRSSFILQFILFLTIPFFKALGVFKRYQNSNNNNSSSADNIAEGLIKGDEAALKYRKKLEKILENAAKEEEVLLQQKNLKNSSDSSREIQEKKQPRSLKESFELLKELPNFNDNVQNTKESITTFTTDTEIKLKENEVFADIFERLGARIIDKLIILIVIFLIGVVLGLFSVNNQPLVYFLYIIYGIYETLLIYFNSATVGKRLFNLRVVSYYANKKISFWKSLLRFIFLSIPLVPLTILFDEKSHRGLHDKLIDTVVIRDKSKSNKLGIGLAIIGVGLIIAGMIIANSK